MVDWPGGTLATFDALNATHDDSEHVGLIARFCAQQPDASDRRSAAMPTNLSRPLQSLASE